MSADSRDIVWGFDDIIVAVLVLMGVILAVVVEVWTVLKEILAVLS